MGLGLAGETLGKGEVEEEGRRKEGYRDCNWEVVALEAV